MKTLSLTAGTATALTFAAVLASCTQPSSVPHIEPPANTAAACGFPPPVPAPTLWLAYPESGATNVPENVGAVIVAGNPIGYYGTDTITLTAAGAPGIVAGAFTAPPSPLPTPYATPAALQGDVPYEAAPVPSLAPATTYTVVNSYADWSDTPPSCRQTVQQTLGEFTTQPAASGGGR